MACSIEVEDVFGPSVAGSCLGGFDFTLLFEESILTLPPLGIAGNVLLRLGYPLQSNRGADPVDRSSCVGNCPTPCPSPRASQSTKIMARGSEAGMVFISPHLLCHRHHHCRLLPPSGRCFRSTKKLISRRQPKVS